MPAARLARPSRARRIGRFTAASTALAALFSVSLIDTASGGAASSGCDAPLVTIPEAVAPRASWGLTCQTDSSAWSGSTHAAEAPPSVSVSTYDNPDGHDNPGFGLDYPLDSAVSPDGTRAFTTGLSWTGPSDMNFAWVTVAFDNDSRSLWVAREEGAFGRFDSARAIAVSPDGKTVFVTGVKDFRIVGAAGYS